MVLTKEEVKKEAKSRTLISLFAGIGGIELGFEKATRGFKAVGANELDPYASLTYKKILGADKFLIEGDVQDARLVSGIKFLKAAKIKKSELDVLSAGFPCQPFSIAGRKEGFQDARGNVFWDVIRLAKDLDPKIIFLENVRNLKTHDNKRTFQTIERALQGLEHKPDDDKIRLPKGRYRVYARVLNATSFGVPQNRERIYIIAVRKDIKGALNLPDEKGTNSIPMRSLADYIDFESKDIPESYYADKFPFHERAKREITEVGAIYQWRRQYVRKNQSGVCPTLTANMGMGGHNVPLILTKGNRIRKLTPEECLALMGFGKLERPIDTRTKKPMADNKLYKQAGNAVVVDVITELADKIADLLDQN
jgi:DNA (cytosine-5)-methyltransferase 1